MRPRTDLAVPVSWLLLPLTSYLLWAIFAVAWWAAGAGLGTSDLALVVSGLGIVGLAASAAASYVVYALMNRANEHSSRTRAVLWSALSELESRIGTTRQEALLPLTSAEEGFYRLSRGEHERSAVLWALLASIPVIGWIFLVAALWFLSRDFAKHSRLEELVLEDLDRTMKGAGLQGVSVRHAPIGARDVLGIAVVTVLLVELLSVFLLGLTGWALSGSLPRVLALYGNSGLLGVLQDPTFSLTIVPVVVVMLIALVLVAIVGAGYVYSSEYGIYVEAWSKDSVPVKSVLESGSRRWRAMAWTLFLSNLITWGPVVIGEAVSGVYW